MIRNPLMLAIAVVSAMALLSGSAQAALMFNAGDATVDNPGVSTNAAAFTPTEQVWRYAGPGSSSIRIDIEGGKFINKGSNNIRSIGYFFDDNQETTGVVNLSFEYSSTDPDGQIGIVFIGTNDLSSTTFDFGWNASESLAGGLSLQVDANDSHYVDGTILTPVVEFTPGNVGTQTFSQDFDLGTTPYNTIGFIIAERSFTNETLTLDNFVIPEPASLALLGLGSLCMLGGRRRRVA